MFRPRRKIKREVATRARIEPLENRRLYSATANFVAYPDMTLAPDLTGGSSGYSPAQIRHAYGFDQAKFGSVAGDGSGQTIAIVDAYNDPNIIADLHAFDQRSGLPDPSLRKVNETGGTSLPGSDAGWSLETALDVEWAHAIAPKANILLVEASSANLSDLMSAVNTARHGSGVSVVSMSWGGSEFWSQGYYDSIFTTPAGHQGVTFVAASGDSGSWYGPQWPASSPNVLAVGGTTLNVSNAAGTYQSETGWSYSGGGISAVEPEPTWQYGVQGTGARTTPDVAYNANTSSGFAVYDSVSYQGYSGWGVVGGTSAGAPQWAALVAIADQGRALNHLGSLDGATQTLPTLYSLTSTAFHDITQGRSSFFYSAHTGYDAVTGLGSPKAQNVIAALAATTTSSSAVSTAVARNIPGAKKVAPAAQRPTAAAAFLSPSPAPQELAAEAPLAVAFIDGRGPAFQSAGGTYSLAVNSTGIAHLPAAILSNVSPPALPFVGAADAPAAGAALMSSGPSVAPGAVSGAVSAADAAGAAVAFGFVRLDPSVLFNDATNALIEETAAISAAGAASLEEHPWAWLVTAGVVAADAVLIARWNLARQKRRTSQANGPDSPFGVTLIGPRE